MSTEPAGTEGKFIPKNHLNVTINKEAFCSASKDCPIDSNIDRSLCIFCKWRKPIDIKHLLYLEICERNNR